MFNKLRNKFLILIMTVTSLILTGAFGAVYAVTYGNIQNNNYEKLKEASGSSIFTGIIGFPGGNGGGLSSNLLPADYSLSFTVMLDMNGVYVGGMSAIDIKAEMYREAGEMAWKFPNGKRAVKLDGRQWLYAFSARSFYSVYIGGSIRNTEGYMVTFVDVSDSFQTLRQLLITFVIVGAVTLILVLIVSVNFANHAVKPLKTAWESQKQFIADASHELKTPLTVINSNYGVLMSRKTETIESQLKWLNYIKEGAGQMERLISGLLYLAKTEQEKIPVQTVDFSMAASKEIAAMLSAAQSRGITVKQEIEPSVMVNCAAEQLGQVVRILFDNAVKYTNENGNIEIELKRERNQTVFRITNTGIGIKAADLPKIFDRFYRADASRTGDGSYGLGLSIAKAIIDGSGGKIIVSSEVGKFTRFKVVWNKPKEPR